MNEAERRTASRVLVVVVVVAYIVAFRSAYRGPLVIIFSRALSSQRSMSYRGWSEGDRGLDGGVGRLPGKSGVSEPMSPRLLVVVCRLLA